MARQIITALWLNDFALTVENRDAVAAQFERQTGNPPTKLVMISELGIWGVANADAVMLFRTPADPTEDAA